MQTFDLTEAKLIMTPEAVRDGGSICFALQVKDSKFNVRYAGGFGDALNARDGKLEFSVFGEQGIGIFVKQEDVSGLKAFLDRYEVEFGIFAEYVLGKRRRTPPQIEEIRSWFERKPKTK